MKNMIITIALVLLFSFFSLFQIEMNRAFLCHLRDEKIHENTIDKT